MITGLNHIAISTPDIDRSMAFYRDLIGMELLGEGAFEGDRYKHIMALDNPKGRIAMLQVGAVKLELFEFATPAPKPSQTPRPVCDHGITHLCFEVDDVENEYQRLKNAGVHFHHHPEAFGPSLVACYGRDPDGNVIELLQCETRLEQEKTP